MSDSDDENRAHARTSVPNGWTQEHRNNRSVWRCPAKIRSLGGGWARCSVTYPRHRIKTRHWHRYVPLNEPSDSAVAKPPFSIPDEIKHHLAVRAGKLNLSSRAATSETMSEFITSIIATTMRYSESHPDEIHDTGQIFCQVWDKTLSQEIVTAANALIDANITQLKSAPISIQMDAATIIHTHFLNYVVSCPGTRPFLFHSAFKDTFNQIDYAEITMQVIERLLTKGLIIAGITADNLFCQQAGLHLLIDQANDCRIRGLIIMPCANHALNLVFRNAIESNPEVKDHMRSLAEFQKIMRSRSATRQYGKLCPSFPESRWIYLSAVLDWIRTERDELIPFILQCIETRNEIGEAFAKSEFQGGIPGWVLPLQELLAILEALSLQMESRKTSLWMVVPLVEAAKSVLLCKGIPGITEYPEIESLRHALVTRLIARFLVTFNAPAAIASYLLSQEGRLKCREGPGFASLPDHGGAPSMTFYQQDQWTRRFMPVAALFQERFSEYWRIHLDHSEVAGPGDLLLSRSDIQDEHFEREFQPDDLDSNDSEPEPEVEPEPEPEAEPEPEPEAGRRHESAPIFAVEQRDMSVLDDALDRSVTHEAQGPRARQAAELAEIAALSTADLIDEAVFKNLCLTALSFLTELAERLEITGKVDVRERRLAWIFGDISWGTRQQDPPEIMWAVAGTDEKWTGFAALAQRVVGIVPSESEVERIISIQRELVGTKGTRLGENVFTARTQLRQDFE